MLRLQKSWLLFVNSIQPPFLHLSYRQWQIEKNEALYVLILKWSTHTHSTRQFSLCAKALAGACAQRYIEIRWQFTTGCCVWTANRMCEKCGKLSLSSATHPKRELPDIFDRRDECLPCLNISSFTMSQQHNNVVSMSIFLFHSLISFFYSPLIFLFLSGSLKSQQLHRMGTMCCDIWIWSRFRCSFLGIVSWY